MIVIGFVASLLAVVAIIIWLDVEFYFKRNVKSESTVFAALIDFTKERKCPLILALACFAAGVAFGVL